MIKLLVDVKVGFKKKLQLAKVSRRDLIHSFLFCVEKVDVQFFSYFSENFICIFDMFKDGNVHVIYAVSST